MKEILQDELNDCTREPDVTEESLLQEIGVLLDDYFIGEFEYLSDKIVYTLPNGNRFELVVKRTA